MAFSKLDLAKHWNVELIDVYKYEKTINSLFILGVLYMTDQKWYGILWKRNKKNGQLIIHNKTKSGYNSAKTAGQMINNQVDSTKLSKKEVEELKLPNNAFLLLKKLDESTLK